MTTREMPTVPVAAIASRITAKASWPTSSPGKRKCGRSYQTQPMEWSGTNMSMSMVRVLSSATASISSSSSMM